MSKKIRFGFLLFLALVTSALFSPSLVKGHFDDGDGGCKDCCPCPSPYRPGGSAITVSEGILREQYQVFALKSAFGPTIDFSHQGAT